MSHNPYRSPSSEVPPDEPNAEPRRHGLIKQAFRFVAVVRLLGVCLIVLGLYLALLPISMAMESQRQIDPPEMATLIGLPLLLLSWGVLQLRVNPIAVSFTGIVALALLLFCFTFFVALLQAKVAVGVIVGALIGLVFLGVLVVVPIATAIEVWIWRWRGIDPAMLAREHERTQQGLHSQNATGAADVR